MPSINLGKVVGTVDENTPITFEDYTSTTAPEPEEALSKITSPNTIGNLFKYIKGFLSNVIHKNNITNSVDTNDSTKIPSSAVTYSLNETKVDKAAIVHNAEVTDATKVPGMDLINSMNNKITLCESRLYTQLDDNTDGFTIFNSCYGLSVFRVNTNVHAPKETSETYIVESINDEYNITQRWISLSDNRVWTRTCDIPNSWLWTSFKELTTQYEETSFNFAGGTFSLKRSGDSVYLYSNGKIAENIDKGWTEVIATIPPSFRSRRYIYVPLALLYGKRLIFRIDTDGKISVFAPQQITVEGDDEWIQSSTMYLI